MKLKGSSMIYALTISMVVSLILSGFVLVNKQQRQLLDKRHFEELARDNMISGINLYLKKQKRLPDFWQSELFDSKCDSIKLERESWGLFQLIHAKGIHKLTRFDRSCLIGQGGWNKEPGLFLEDQQTPLMVVGKTYLKGALILPKSGIQNGSIGKRGFEGSWDKQLFSSQGQENNLNFTFLAELKQDLALRESFPNNKPLLVLNDFDQSTPWEESTYELNYDGELFLKNFRLRGKNKIIADKVKISAQANLKHSLIIAREIEVESGFTGQVQLIATERLIIKNRVNLLYPSILAVFKQDKPAQLFIEEGSLVEGGVIFDTKLLGSELDRRDYCLIDRGTEIYGPVSITHNFDLKGNVFGPVSTGNFKLKTSSTTYKNYLLDAFIDPYALSPKFTGPIIKSGNDFRIIDFLEKIQTRDEN